MPSQNHTIPLVLVNVVLGAGCTPAVVGQWSLFELDNGHYLVTDDYNPDFIWSRYADLSLDQDLSARMGAGARATYNGVTSSFGYYLYAGYFRDQGEGEYDIILDGTAGALHLTCTADVHTLSCDGAASTEHLAWGDLPMKFASVD